MLSTYSVLYLYDVSANPGSELKTDYLLVNHLDDFKEWLFKDPDRRQKYVTYYNETFNNIRFGNMTVPT